MDTTPPAASGPPPSPPPPDADPGLVADAELILESGGGDYRGRLATGREHYARVVRAKAAAIRGGRPRPRGPGPARTVANFAAAVASHVAAGLPKVSAEVALRRTQICETCPSAMFDPAARRCRHSNCNCYIDRKVRWADQACPLGHWGRETGTEAR